MRRVAAVAGQSGEARTRCLGLGLRTSHAVQTVAAACARTAVALGLALASSLVAAAPVAAHGALSSTSPSDGEEVASSPQVVVLDFNEVPLPLGTRIVVTGPDGSVVTVGDAQLERSRVSQQLQPQLPSGLYRVVWRATSDDGHPVSGEFGFSVSTGSASQPTAGGTSPSAASATPRSGPQQATPPSTTAAPEVVGATPASEGAGTDVAASAATATSDGDGGVSAGAALTGAAALALVAGLLVLFGKRRGQSLTQDVPSGPGHDPAHEQGRGPAWAPGDDAAPEEGQR